MEWAHPSGGKEKSISPAAVIAYLLGKQGFTTSSQRGHNACKGERMRVAFILLLASAFISRADENAAGRWEGAVQITGRPLEVIVDLAAKSDKGGRQGSITIPGLEIKGAPLSDIALNSDKIAFSIKSALADQRTGPAKFNGHFIGDGKLAGDFVQAGNAAPFALQKTGPPQVEVPPRSSAIAKEIEGEWKGGYE